MFNCFIMDKSGISQHNWHRFFVDPDCLQKQQVLLSGSQAHQICNVLRLKQGQQIIVLDNSGNEFEVELTDVGKNQVKGKVKRQQEADGEPAVWITLFQSILKREKFEQVLQKCTEVGVAKFVPVICRRSIVQAPDIKAAKLERWQKIIQQAAEQSHRGRIPQLDKPARFSDVIKKTGDFDCVVMASPTAGASLKECLDGCRKAKKIGLFVGPEGGFTTDEIDTAKTANVTEFAMGKTVLRTETAAIVAAALILYELEMEG